MGEALSFVDAVPRDAAAGLDADTIHLWRMAYDPSRRRAPLIALLAAYLGVPASTVTLGQGAKGKPRLQAAAVGSSQTRAHRADAMLSSPPSGQTYPPGADAALSFNWSHSGEYALVALARRDALGVDIERLGKQARVLGIAQRFFDPAEAALLASLDPVSRQRAFIGLWCAKEAVLKAAGEGLSFGLARLAFTSRSGRDWALARVDPALGDVSAWQLSGFSAAPGYRGALAWRGAPKRIVAFDLDRAARSG
ncbi:MAG: 4'-phosphopantetheinyl transferase family protein [Rhodanobacteraceae bacterium]